jgi:hypothetical protein
MRGSRYLEEVEGDEVMGPRVLAGITLHTQQLKLPRMPLPHCHGFEEIERSESLEKIILGIRNQNTHVRLGKD